MKTDDKYTFSRLTDNNIFDYTLVYLTAFHVNVYTVAVIKIDPKFLMSYGYEMRD